MATKASKWSLAEWLNFQPRQQEFLNSCFKYRYNLFGGAKGPGKSYALRGILVALHLYWAAQGIKGVTTALFCQTFKQLQDRQISKMREWPAEMGRLRTGQLGLGFYFTEAFGGGVICLRNLEQDRAGEKSSRYKSAEFAAVAVEELTEIEQRKTFDNLRSSMRFPGIDHTVFLAATNPDGPGLEWVRELWIERSFPAEYITAGIDKEFNFIPALPTDNKYLDEAYWNDLKSQTKETQQAWLEGNWYVFSGRAFKDFKVETHVIPYNPDLPMDWVRKSGHDYGFSSPYCVLWGAKDLTMGRLVVYRELYEVLNNDRLQAKKILYMSEDRERFIRRWADPHFWDSKSDTSGVAVSAAKVYAQNGVYLSKANNDRAAGKRQISRMLAPLGDGLPGLLIMDNCTHLISQLLKAIHDPKNPEDVYTSNHYEDHAYDTLRYLVTDEGDRDKKKRDLANEKQSIYAAKALVGYL